MAWVYGIQSGLFIKIGVASDIGSRVKTMNLYNPHPCKVVMRRRHRDPYWVEKRLHQTLEPYSIGREWFMVDVKLVRAAMTVVLKEYLQRRNDQIMWQAESAQRVEAREIGRIAESTKVRKIRLVRSAT